MSIPQPTTPEHLHIDTPEQVQLQYRLAGVGSRFLAIALDTLYQIGAAIVVGVTFLLLSLTGLLQKSGAGLWLMAAGIAIVFLLYFGYFVIFEIAMKGQTPGKRRIGIRVIKDSGRPLNVVETIGRNLMRIIDSLPGFYGIGILSAVISPQGKRLGDFVAGSIVIHEGTLEDVRSAWRPQAAVSGDAIATALGGNRLSVDDAVLIQAFLARRSDLDGGVRTRIAGEIVGRLAPKLSLTADHIATPETTLEALLREHRG